MRPLRHLKVPVFCLAIFAFAWPCVSRGDDSANPRSPAPSRPAVDKRVYNLFNPTPRELMRDFNTDRPSQTTTPFTVDAGHVQVEASILTFAYDRHYSQGDATTITAYQVFPTNVRIGLLDNFEADVMFAPYNRVAIHERNFDVIEVERGIGDLTLAFKLNLFGNEGGEVALGVVPFFTFPTSGDNSNGGFQTGVIVPVAVKLPLAFGLGLQTEVFEARNSGGGHHVELVDSAVLDHELLPKLDGYVEVYTDASREAHAKWSVQFDTGLVYQLTDNLSLDGGVNLGLTETAPDVMPFLGFSARF